MLLSRHCILKVNGGFFQQVEVSRKGFTKQIGFLYPPLHVKSFDSIISSECYFLNNLMDTKLEFQ
jgi:hypothetical protein